MATKMVSHDICDISCVSTRLLNVMSNGRRHCQESSNSNDQCGRRMSLCFSFTTVSRRITALETKERCGSRNGFCRICVGERSLICFKQPAFGATFSSVNLLSVEERHVLVNVNGAEHIKKSRASQPDQYGAFRF